MKLEGSKLIVRNTGILYAKTFITMGISLYSTRVILNALGATDFGIYSLVGGVIAMLTFLNNSMTQATQRFLNFNLGAGNIKKLHEIFNASVYLHLIIAFIVVAIVELAGYFALGHLLNIPVDRLASAKVIFHLVVIGTFFTIISVPYDGVINAHEHMLFDSVIGVLQALGVLSIALIVKQINGDKLIWYGALMVALMFSLLIVRRIYCKTQYAESKINFKEYLNKSTVYEMISYAKYTLISAVSSMFGAFGVPIILNLFFGTIVNAAHGIAIQINGQIMVFSNSMVKALNPQLTKSEGANDRVRMIKLAHSGSKFGFYLLAIFAIPFIIEADFILKLWLKNPPEFSIIFCQLALIVSMVNQLSLPIGNMVNAQGSIKKMSYYSSIVFISILPIIYLLYYLKFPPYSFYITQLFSEIVLFMIRIRQSAKLVSFNFKIYLQEVLTPICIISSIIIIVGLTIQNLILPGISRLIISIVVSSITFLSLIYLIGLSVTEKNQIKHLFQKYTLKKFLLLK